MDRSAFKAWARPFWRKFKLLRLAGALIHDSYYDLRRYLRWSHGTDTDRTEPKRRHALYKAYHGVEKGLSLANPRPGFGVTKIGQLVGQIRALIAKDGPDYATAAISALHGYSRFNASEGVESSAALSAFLADYPNDTGDGGVETITGDALRAQGAKADRDFFWSRHSIRNFSDKPVALDVLREVVDMARKTPTVCNRQGPKVHIFEDAEDALRHQPGNRGFGHLASRAMVVTTDLQAFSGRGERHQAYVDGGMFAMSLLYAVHAAGLGACPLAWTTDAATDRKTRKQIGIPDNEAIILMIAVGHLPDQLSVARAHRMPIEDFLVSHPSLKERSDS